MKQASMTTSTTSRKQGDEPAEALDVTNCGLFTPIRTPESGVTIHVLTSRVAPVQKGFYFVNESMTADGRYLWFCCGYPPSQHKVLAVLDFEQQQVRVFPETQFVHESPFVDVDTAEVFWTSVGFGRGEIWRRGPNEQDEAVVVNALPGDLLGKRSVDRMSTHLTRSSDKRAFFIDARLASGLMHLYGALPIDGSPFDLWHRLDRNYNHAQFSPTDPDEVLLAEENHPDPITGLNIPITNRLWLMRRSEPPRPILRAPCAVTHEWWDADGQHVWCVRGSETWRVRVRDGEVEVLPFPHHCWHSHSSRDGRLLVGDSHPGDFYRGCPSSVHFFNRDSGKRLTLVTNPACQDFAGRHYHIDPHPRFCCGDRYVVFTTTILGRVDVALVPTMHLQELTA